MKIYEVHSDGRVGYSHAVISVYVERSNVAVSGLDSGAQLYLEPNVLVLHILLRTYEDMQTHKQTKANTQLVKVHVQVKSVQVPSLRIVQFDAGGLFLAFSAERVHFSLCSLVI